MARRKKDAPVDGAQENVTNELGELAVAVAVANDADIASAFGKFDQGGKYYQIFQKAMKAEIKRLASGEVEEETENLAEVLAEIGDELESFQTFIRSLSSERLFAVLNVVTRNFGGTPLPPAGQAPAPAPAPRQAPAQKPAEPAPQPTPKKATLKKRFAAANTNEVTPEAPNSPAAAPASANQPAATTMPPRGNRIPGLL